MSDQVDRLRVFAARGLAAQRAVDQVLAQHGPIRTDDLQPWKHCDVEGCSRWTRGAFCPQHRADEFEAPTVAARAGKQNATKRRPR